MPGVNVVLALPLVCVHGCSYPSSCPQCVQQAVQKFLCDHAIKPILGHACKQVEYGG